MNGLLPDLEAVDCSQPDVTDGSEGVEVPSLPSQQFPTEDWSTQTATEE